MGFVLLPPPIKGLGAGHGNGEFIPSDTVGLVAFIGPPTAGAGTGNTEVVVGTTGLLGVDPESVLLSIQT